MGELRGCRQHVAQPLLQTAPTHVTVTHSVAHTMWYSERLNTSRATVLIATCINIIIVSTFVASLWEKERWENLLQINFKWFHWSWEACNHCKNAQVSRKTAPHVALVEVAGHNFNYCSLLSGYVGVEFLIRASHLRHQTCHMVSDLNSHTVCFLN